MTVAEEKTFEEMCSRLGLDGVQTSEMRGFIEAVCDTASERGEIRGSSPFDGTWPTEG